MLVVIVIIGVLAALILAVASGAIGGQKASTTRNTMRLIRLAIDQFATEDPLQALYNSPNLRAAGDPPVPIGRTFGPYPPYQLANVSTGNTVARTLEPNPWLPLSTRLWRDLGSGQGQKVGWVDLQDGNRNDDIRALYCYLAAYSRDVLTQIPDEAKRPLPDRAPVVPPNPEMINPTGQGTDPGDSGAIDVLGFYDAWGVPLDYLLYVKVEYMVPADGGAARWVVTDRVPVLRSRGVTAEAAGSAVDRPQQWIFSEAFPQPWANVSRDTGVIAPWNQLNPPSGWARVRAGGIWNAQNTWDDYLYVPEP